MSYARPVYVQDILAYAHDHGIKGRGLQAQLSKATGIDQPSICRYFSGEKEPELETLMRIIAVLHPDLETAHKIVRALGYDISDLRLERNKYYYLILTDLDADVDTIKNWFYRATFNPNYRPTSNIYPVCYRLNY